MRSVGFHQANMIAENLNIVREEVLTEVHNVQNVVADAMASIPHNEEYIQPPPQNQTTNAVITTLDMAQLISQISTLATQFQNMQNMQNNSGGRGGRGDRGN